MINIYYSIKGYLQYLFNLNAIAPYYFFAILFATVLIIIYEYSGYSGKIYRGSRKTIKFFNDKGWVDNSNISQFLITCLRKYPYIIRANFSIYTNTDKPFSELVNHKSYYSRDYSLREKLMKYIFDFVLVASTVITFVYTGNNNGYTDAIRCLIVMLFAIIFRYALFGALTFREIRGKKLFVKALDLMNNGIFISNPTKSGGKNNIVKDYLNTMKEDKDISDVCVERISDSEGIIQDSSSVILDIKQEKTH